MRTKPSEKWSWTVGIGKGNSGLVQYLLRIIVLYIKRQHIMEINQSSKVKKQIASVFVVCLMALLGTSPLFAQNIANADFESGNSGFQSDYTYVNPQDYNGQNVGIENGKYTIDNTSSGHGIGSIGWPTILGYGGSGKYMLANGFGGNTNPTKAAWKQTVTVTPNTDYIFSCQVVNLAQSVFGYSPNPAILRLKINGSTVGGDYTVAQNNSWHEWSISWHNGNATQAEIAIYDVYTGDSGLGDDFGLDHLSLTPQATYSVNAVDDDVPLCVEYYQTYQIDVLANDIITPSSQMSGATVQVIQAPAHGNASWNNNTHKINYTFMDQGYYGGLDQFKYRVTIPHGESSDAWVYVNTGRTPDVGWIDTPGPICAGGSLGISVPSVQPDQGGGQWVCSQTQNGTFSPFDSNNVPLSMNGWYVKYKATNDCGDGYSNTVQITVTNGPSWASGQAGQTPQIQPVCAGGNLSLTPPSFNANGLPILSQGWVISQTENGEYQSFSLNNISSSYNGWYICYMVESSCGAIYSTPKRQLVVNVAPDVTGTLQAPEAICAGDDLDVTIPAYSGNGTGSWEISQNANGTYQSFTPQNVPATYNNWYIHYKVSNDCGSDVSNAVQIHVYDEPTISTPATPQAICAGNSFNLTMPTIQNNGSTITNQGWQIAAQQNGSYNAFNNSNVPYTYNGYWIRYFAENECGMTYSTAVQITVNDVPEVGPVTVPAGICAGQSFALTTPTVNWRHTNQGTGSWEIAPTSTGEFTALTNNNIPFSYNGYYIRYKAVNGCGTSYSTNVVQVTVFSTEPTYDTITACDTYVWNGVTCNHTGNYQAQVQNENGCTITAHLHFIMSDAYTETQTVSECDSYTWPKNGQTYTSTGNYEYTVQSGNPLVCDSIFTLNLTINHAPEITANISSPSDVCSGSPLNVVVPQYAFNHSDGGDAHWEYATSQNGPFTAFDPSSSNLSYGTYYLRFAVINSCDEVFSNVVPFHVNDVPVVTMQLSALQVCEGQSLELPEANVAWNNVNENDRVSQWQMASTQNGTYAQIDPTMPMQMSYNGYWIRFWAHNSCGDDYVGPVMVTVIAEAEEWLDAIEACDSFTLESGEVINETQVVDYETYDPCLHTVHQPIIINHSDHVVEPITSCHETYEWHGMTFYHSDQTQYATVTLTNMANCDSVVELQLDFDEFASYTHNRIACDSYEWEMNPGHIYYETQRDSVFVPAVDPDDCDTWYYLNLTLGQNTLIDGGTMTECSGFVWHGVPYYQDAVVYDSLYTAVTHCDSIISYNLTIIPPQSSEESIVSCQPIWWQEHYCDEPGDYQHTFLSQQGCDSIVTMHFSLADVIVHEFDTLACEPFTWFDYNCDQSGMTCTHDFLTPMGCDSTVIMHVDINSFELSTQFISACDYYEWEGVVYDEPGVYLINLDTLFGQQGCDSIVYRIRLEVKDSDQMGHINGASHVYVANNMISGIYRYEIDQADIQGGITWSLANPEWQIVEAQDNYCRIFVGTPGTNTLTAAFITPECGELRRDFEINAGFFGVGEQALEVTVFPNPTKGTVTVEAEGIECVRLTNMLGQVLEQREFDRSDSVILSLAGYVPSVYLLEIKTVNGMVKKRVVLCR